MNNDDLNPKYEETDLMEEKIIPVSNELAFQFASEIINSNPDSQKIIANYQNIQMIEIMDRKPHINCNITNKIA